MLRAMHAYTHPPRNFARLASDISRVYDMSALQRGENFDKMLQLGDRHFAYWQQDEAKVIFIFNGRVVAQCRRHRNANKGDCFAVDLQPLKTEQGDVPETVLSDALAFARQRLKFDDSKDVCLQHVGNNPSLAKLIQSKYNPAA